MATAVTMFVIAVPSSHASATACGGQNGVTVVVQYDTNVLTGCASGDPSSGAQALRDAGFRYDRAQREQGLFVCRINGYPASEPCQRAAPTHAYWSYWHASPGGTWASSATGAATYDPKPGSVEGWAFGAGSPPSSPPPSSVIVTTTSTSAPLAAITTAPNLPSPLPSVARAETTAPRLQTSTLVPPFKEATATEVATSVALLEPSSSAAPASIVPNGKSAKQSATWRVLPYLVVVLLVALIVGVLVRSKLQKRATS